MEKENSINMNVVSNTIHFHLMSYPNTNTHADTHPPTHTERLISYFKRAERVLVAELGDSLVVA